MNTKAPDYRPDDKTAVIIGAAQYKESIPVDLSRAHGPVHMAAHAAEAALKDTNLKDADLRSLTAMIDTVFCVRTFGDSGMFFSCPFPTSQNMPKAVAREVGIEARRHVYGVIGGNTPQSFVAEAVEAIEAGAAKAVLICGGEAIANMKTAMRADVSLDWSDAQDRNDLEDRGDFAPDALPLISRSAEHHKLFAPLRYYSLMENARRAKQGLRREEYRRDISSIMAGLLQTSKNNPLSVFSDVASDLNGLTQENPLFTDLYSKSILPKDGVNQGAALILTSYGHAIEIGIDPRRFIYLCAHAEGSEPPLLQRPELDKSTVLEACFREALDTANIQAQDIGLRDLYSCFPIVLKESAAALGLNIYEDDLTLTGGLAFFGGPGNNYSLHGIAQLVADLRNAQSSYGLVHANGGFMSKHAVGIYSRLPAKKGDKRFLRHIGEDSSVLEMAESAQGKGWIDSYLSLIHI